MTDKSMKCPSLMNRNVLDSFLDLEQRIRSIEKRQSKQSWIELATTLTGLFLTSALINALNNRRSGVGKNDSV